MSYVQIPNRTTANTNASADINQLQDNIEAVKGGVAATAPTTTVEDLKALVTTNTSDVSTNTSDISTNVSDISTNSSAIAVLQNNLKQYVGGSTYNGVALTVTGANFTLTRGVFVPCLTFVTSLGGDATYRMKVNITGTLSTGAASPTLTVAGISAKAASGDSFFTTGAMTGERILMRRWYT